MEAPPSAKPRRGSPPIPPNYVSLRQLQELRLKEKEEQEKRQREEEEAAAAAAAAAMAKREAARKAEAMAAAAVKRDAARKPETKVSAVVPVPSVRAKERRGGGLGAQWVAVAHQPAAPQPACREAVREAPAPIGVGRGNKPPTDAPRGGGKLDGKEKISADTSAQARAADVSGKPAENSSHGGKPENKGGGMGKAKAKKAASGDEDAEPGSIGGSGESAGAPYRHRKNRKWKKGAASRSAEPSGESAPVKTDGASPPQGDKTEDNAGKSKSPGDRRADASTVVSDSSRGKKADATPAPPTWAAAGELCVIAETKPEGLVEGHRRSLAVEVQGAAEQKPRVASRRAWPRPPGDRRNGAGEQWHGRVWVPKAAAGCNER